MSQPNLISISPFECRMWDLHERLESRIDEESCRTEIESFSKHGQLLPVLGRPLRGDPMHRVELIYGARRLFVARHINCALRVELREVSDREGIILMDIENRHRSDISSYERGQSFARWLQIGHFGSQKDIATALNISTAQVSRLLKLTQLPVAIVQAFSKPEDICESWGLELFDAVSEQPRRQATLQCARAIGAVSPRPSALEIYQKLLCASTPGRKVQSRVQEEIVRDNLGAPLFRIRYQNKSIALVLARDSVSAQSLENIRQNLSSILVDNHKSSRPKRLSHVSGEGSRVSRVGTGDIVGSSTPANA